jgi:hypothetical protein
MANPTLGSTPRKRLAELNNNIYLNRFSQIIGFTLHRSVAFDCFEMLHYERCS